MTETGEWKMIYKGLKIATLKQKLAGQIGAGSSGANAFAERALSNIHTGNIVAKDPLGMYD